MDFWELLKVLVRRWAIVVPILVLSVIAALSLGGRVQPTYEATGSVLLVAPTFSPLASENVYIVTGLPTTAEAMTLAVNSSRVREEMAAAGNSPSYVVVAQRRTPIVTIDAEGDTAKQAVNTVNGMVKILARELERRQESSGAPKLARISVANLTPEVASSPVYDGARRLKVVILGAGTALAVLLALALEALAVLRRRGVPETLEGVPAAERNKILASQMALLDERERVLDRRARLIREHATAAASSGEPPTRAESPPKRSEGPAATSAVNGAPPTTNSLSQPEVKNYEFPAEPEVPQSEAYARSGHTATSRPD